MQGLFGRARQPNLFGDPWSGERSALPDYAGEIDKALARNAMLPRPKKKFDWGEAALGLFADPEIMAARRKRKAEEAAALTASLQPGQAGEGPSGGGMASISPPVRPELPAIGGTWPIGAFSRGLPDYMAGIHQALARNEAIRRRKRFDWGRALLGAFADSR